MSGAGDRGQTGDVQLENESAQENPRRTETERGPIFRQFPADSLNLA